MNYRSVYCFWRKFLLTAVDVLTLKRRRCSNIVQDYVAICGGLSRNGLRQEDQHPLTELRKPMWFRVDRCRMQTTMTEQPAINTQLW